MHAHISQHRVDVHYVNDICGIFFETMIDSGNMVSAMFDEELKVEVEHESIKCELAREKASQVRVCHDSILSKLGHYIIIN